jgi:S-DNA-T family DNA segregation ATPase FtsK/SpoIIIE
MVLCRPCHEKEHGRKFPDLPAGGVMATRTRRPARRTAKAPKVTHDQRRNLHGVGALIAALLSIPLLLIPQGSMLTDWLGVVGDALLVAGLLLVGVRLLLGHGHASAAGVGIAIPGLLGLTALVPWTRGGAGSVGGSLADSAAGWVGPWWSVVLFVGLTCLGLVLAVDLDVPVVAGAMRDGMRRGLRSERLWGWIRGEESGDTEEPAEDETHAPAQAGRNWQGVPWLAGPMREAMANPPRPSESPKPATDDGQYPAGDSGQTALMVLPDLETGHSEWLLPPIDLLDEGKTDRVRQDAEIRDTRSLIESTLESFGVMGKVIEVNPSPRVTQYVLQPAPGVSVRRITTRQTDLSLALAATIRIQAPIPGKAAVGIEVPNKAAQLVTLRSLVQAPAFRIVARTGLAIALGADLSGQSAVGDLTTTPHLLIGGATNSGKSVYINVLLASLLLQATPDQLRIVLIDPKVVELEGYAGIPHLLRPIVNDADEAVEALREVVDEMDKRYRILAGSGSKNIAQHNTRAEPLPRIVVVIDELADLVLRAKDDVEEALQRLAQLARAAGIHLVAATQRPSAELIPADITANFPSRIAFRVSSGVNSRVILDEMGAEKLAGRGDMLCRLNDDGETRRMQGAYVSESEMGRLIRHWKGQRRAG